MKLTTEQIGELYAFTRKKYVQWYDLQTELVDHLAEQITKECEANPSLSFETALEKVYAGFGIFGFGQIVRERTESLQRKQRKLLLKSLVNEFSWPKILRASLVYILFYTLFSNLNFSIVLYSTITILIAVLIRFVVLDNRRKKDMRKPLMLMQSSFTTSVLLVLQYVFIFMPNVYFGDGTLTSSWQISIAAVFFLLGFLTMLASIAVDEKFVNEARTLYPEAFKLV